MATNHNVLADALDRMALQQEAVIEAARAFRAVGSVEAAIAAREADLRSVNKTIEAKKQELASLDERLRTGNDTLEKLKAEAAKQVAEQIAAARERADEMVSAAEAQAATMRADVGAQVDGMTARAAVQAKQAQSEAAAAVAEMNAAHKARDEANAELKSLNQKLADVRAKMRELIGE
jgi:chromosome segregation ATPase